MSKIIIGDGIVSINPTDEIRGFHIFYKGVLNADIKLSSDWHVSANSNQILGFTTGGSILDITTILEYTGTFNVKRCVVATHTEAMNCNIEKNVTDFFEDSTIQFDVSTTKLDESNKTDMIKTRVRGFKVRHTYLETKQNEYYYQDKTVVPEGTPYHIDCRTQQVMTESLYRPESKKIYQLLSDGRLNDIKKLKKQLKPKQYVNKSKIKLSI